MSKKMPTNEALEEALVGLREREATLKAEMADRQKQIAKLSAEQAIAQSEAGRLGRKIAETHNRLFVRTVLDPKLVAARKRFINKLQLSGSGDITVKKQRTLLAEVEADKAALQKLCTHPYVFSYDGNRSYSSWEESEPGHRVCTICNLYERSQSAQEDVYDVLDGDQCLVRRDLREGSRRSRLAQEWFPTKFLQQLFEVSAGGSNIVWPRAEEPASKS